MSKKFFWGILFLGLAVGSSGCGGGNGPSTGAGTINMSLTDSTTNEFKAVYVTIQEVQVHKEGGNWQGIASPNKTLNLLELVNGLRESLAIAVLETGHYTQMRLILGQTADSGINILSQVHPFANYFIDNNNHPIELKIPSGFQTGIKIVQGFDINQNQTTELILDFDAAKSIIRAGRSGKWLLNPTIKVLDTRECSILSGTVTDSAGQAKAGALVSAQIYDPGAVDVAGRVVIETSTVSDETGAFKIFLRPGSYTLVAYWEGFAPAYQKITPQAGVTYGNNSLVLNGATTGNLTGTVSIGGAAEEQYVSLSARQAVTLNGNSEQIEVQSLIVADGGGYAMVLPVGGYTAVASTFGFTTQSRDVNIIQNTDTVVDFVF